MYDLKKPVAPAPALAVLSAHDHPCSIYEDAAELKSQFVPYLQAGLLLGERCIYFIDENDEQFVLDAMHAGGFNLQPYLDNGAFLVIHTQDAHLLGGHFSEDKMMAYWQHSMAAAKLRGFTTVRAAVEMTWALSGAPGCDILAPYESRLNKFTDSNNIGVICQYHRKKFSPEKLKAVVHAHPLVVVGDSVLHNPAVVPAHNFVEGCPDLDLQATLDSLEMIKQLNLALLEQTRMQFDLEQKKRQCESLYEELQVLTRVMSHEMQAPLNIISSYLSLLSVRYSHKLGPDADEFIGKSVNASRTVKRMIDDLWTYARIEFAAEKEEQFEALEVLGEVLVELDDLFKQSNVEFQHQRLPRITTSREHFKYLLRALIENSAQHAKRQTVTISVNAEETADHWQFAVTDNGVGLDAVHGSHVFRMFSRLHSKPDETGTGMGLPIAKRIAEARNCQLWFDSKPGTATTFYFTVPKRD